MILYRVGQHLRRHALAYAASLGVCLLALAVFLHFRDDEPDGLPDLVFEHAGDPVIGAVVSAHSARFNTAQIRIYQATRAAKLPKRIKLIEDCAAGAPGAAEEARRFLLAAGPEVFAEAQQARDSLIAMPEFRPLPRPCEFPDIAILTSLEAACLHAEGKPEEARRLWTATLKSLHLAALRIRVLPDSFVLGVGDGTTSPPLDLPVILASRVASAEEARSWLDCLGEPFDLQTPARRCIRNAVCLEDANFDPLSSAKAGIATWRTLTPALPFDWKKPDSWLLHISFRWIGANTLPNATMKLLRERFRADEHLIGNPYNRNGYAKRDEDLPALMFLEWNYGGKRAALSAQRLADVILRQYHLAETRQRLRFTAAAILRHALRTGEFPQTLAELKLPAPLGLDSYTGNPLKWDASTHRLWSVGSDLRDDGGTATYDLVLELGNPPWLAPQSK